MAAILLLTLCSCTPIPGTVSNAANDYGQVLSDNYDGVLVRNIIRASYHAPLHLSDVSSLSSTYTLSGGFGGTAQSGGNTVSITPSLNGTSVPTFNMLPLNTNAVTTALITPITPQFIVSLWHGGSSNDYRQFLLRLFIKYVELRNGDSCINLPESKTEPACLDWFSKIDDVRSVMVMEPIGPAFDVSKLKQAQALTGIDTSEAYRIGDAGNGKFQIYRVYAGQVVVCTADASIAPKLPPSRVQRILREQTPRQPAAPASPSPPSQGSSQSQTVGGGSKQNTLNNVQTTVNTALQQNRATVILNEADAPCRQDTIVLPPMSEEKDAASRPDYSRIEERSTEELFDYLGALVRYEQSDKRGPIMQVARKTFALVTNPASATFVRVSFRGKNYGVVGENSMRSLRILSDLVNLTKVSSELTPSSPSLILPIP